MGKGLGGVEARVSRPMGWILLVLVGGGHAGGGQHGFHKQVRF